jgi:hypothetical protein
MIYLLWAEGKLRERMLVVPSFSWKFFIGFWSAPSARPAGEKICPPRKKNSLRTFFSSACRGEGADQKPMGDNFARKRAKERR